MMAAKTISNEAIVFLLQNNARPNDFDKKMRTALTYSIMSENVGAVKILLPLTTKHLDVSLKCLAESKCKDYQDIKEEIKNLVNNDKNLLWTFLERATMFGTLYWQRWLLDETDISFLNEEQIQTLMKNAILSDEAEACKLILTKFRIESLSEEMINYALSHEKKKMLEVLKIEHLFPTTNNEKDNLYKNKVKSEEFPYQNNLEKIVKKWLKIIGQNEIRVKLKELLEEMKAPTVHYTKMDDEEVDECPDDCVQKRKCLRIRQVQKLILDMMEIIGKKFKIFEKPQLIVVGSMKEGTKGRIHFKNVK